MNDPGIKISIQDKTGEYYIARKDNLGVWAVTTQPAIAYLETLPDGWTDLEVTWDRDPSYLGVIRGGSDGTMKFSKDGRAIIQYIARTQGLLAYADFNIYVIQYSGSSITYPLFYPTKLDFKTCVDHWQTEILEIGTLESDLIKDVLARGDTQFNIPIWTNTSAPGDPPVWVTDAEFIYRDGVKLQYQSKFTSGATTDNYPRNILYYTSSPTGYSPGGQQLNGWNKGAGVNAGDGYHIIFPLAQQSFTQNNGTTTWIGNDILQPFILTGDQKPGAANFASENDFNDTNHSQPYTRNNYSVKNLLNSEDAYPEVYVSLVVKFSPGPGHAYGDPPAVAMAGATTTGRYMAIVVFEIDGTDSCVRDPSTGYYLTPGDTDPATGLPSGAIVLNIPLPNSTGADFFWPTSGFGANGFYDTTDSPVPLVLNKGKTYAFGMIHDIGTGGGSGIACSFMIQQLEFTFKSKADFGVSGVPVPALRFPASFFAGFRLNQVLEKLVPYLPTTNTDGYGFPIPITTAYTGASTYLSDSGAAPQGDGIPYNNMLTSAYCVRDLAGQSYISISLNQLFDYCKKVWGCGLGIIGNTLRIENLRYFFDNTTMILDLGTDVEDFELGFAGEELGIGANLKVGYTKADTNTDNGVFPFCTSCFYNTPAAVLPGVMDYEEDSILTEMYAQEKIIAQKNSQPIGQAYDPANPSSDNQTLSYYVMPTPSTSITVTPYDPGDPSHPGGQPYPLLSPGVRPYRLAICSGDTEQLPTAQSTDPTAATAPYIANQPYPDTCVNLQLSPGRFLQRDGGALIRSVLDKMDAKSLTYRGSYVMQFNNTVAADIGTVSNLAVGASAAPIVEFSDKSIGALPAQLFRPKIVKITSKYPVNMYQILNANPYGYVRFLWQNKNYTTTEVKFFINKATQIAATGMATRFEGLLTPDMTI